MKLLQVGGDESWFVEIGSRRVSGGGWLEEGMEEVASQGMSTCTQVQGGR